MSETVTVTSRLLASGLWSAVARAAGPGNATVEARARGADRERAEARARTDAAELLRIMDVNRAVPAPPMENTPS